MIKKEKAMCNGCYNDDYNYGLGGAKGCWSFKDAKLIDRIRIHINQSPPYDKTKAEKRLSCYRKPQWVFVEPENLTSEGYWK